MSEIANILVPIYEYHDNYPAYEHALWLAKTFDAALLIVGVIDKGKFVRVISAHPPSLGGAALDTKAFEKFRSELKGKTDALANQAIQLGINADNMVMDKFYPDALVDLTRRYDIMIESRLHRRAFFARIGEKDIYTDSCCPILVTRGEPYKMTPALLIYNKTEGANQALRWFIYLAERDVTLNLRVLVLWRNDKERERLLREVKAFAKAHSVDVRIDDVPAKGGFRRTVELTERLWLGIVAMPTYAFPRPLRLRIHGIDMRALNEIQASVLLFP